ncbi:MAG: invasin domain 3-containing protein [Candidatus Cloacimonadales bacterium]|nr:invasin domain 3-containing protein [Candidatus Cloacimonadales bacterium]
MKSRKYFILISLIVLATFIAIMSCDNRTTEPQSVHITNMTAVPDTIYADNNVTYSMISVTVKDDDNFAVTGEPVHFRTDIGNLIYEVFTDSSGVAQSTFWDNGVVGIAQIDAFVGDENESVIVVIEEEPEIESLILEATDTMPVARTTLIRAIVANSIGYVPDGTIVVFETNKGYFQASDGTDLGSITQITTSNSVAKVTFNSSTETGLANIAAKISDVETEHIINIKPGVAAIIDLTATPEEIQVNSGENSVITALLKDSYNNPVLAGVGVDFTTTLGNITAFSITDENGIAEAIFYPGVQSGIAEIEAVSDSASASTAVTVFSDGVYSIVYAFSGQVSIAIQGTGGQESFEFIVNLYDSNGNLIDQPETVWFKFMNGPVGANINNQIFMPSTDSLSVLSENGRATVSVNSGTHAGPIALKASTINAVDSLYISAIKSNIVINSGPPNSIDVSIGDMDSGTNMGGGVWQIQCAAIINDQWGNPVDHGTAVWFSLTDPEFPGTDPTWATIEAAAYVQNENATGDSLEGVAFTLLNFEGSHINDTLVVWVEVSGEYTFMDSSSVTMPLQFGTISMLPTPSHVDWTWHVPQNPNPPPLGSDSLSTTIRVQVLDGQNNPINNQLVYFTTSHGIPYPNSPGADPYSGLTGNIGGQNGLLHKLIYFQYYECAPPIPAPPGTTQVTIEASILGTDVTGQTTITLNRYID